MPMPLATAKAIGKSGYKKKGAKKGGKK